MVSVSSSGPARLRIAARSFALIAPPKVARSARDRRGRQHRRERAVSVYLDDAMILWRGRRWSHLYADTLAELIAFGDRVGLKREWLQNPDGKTGLPHYDVTGVMRDRCMFKGAVLVEGGDGTYRRLRRALHAGEYVLEPRP